MDRNELAIQALKDIKIHPKQKKETRFEFGLMIALEALEKQTPKKVTDMKSVKFNGSFKMNFSSGKCPNCGEYVDSDDDRNGCQNCLQRLDWSEEDEVD